MSSTIAKVSVILFMILAFAFAYLANLPEWR